jgi:hypothetical protein
MNGRDIVLVIKELSALLDTGMYDAISIQDVKKHIRTGDILRFISEMAGTESDFSAVLQSRAGTDFERLYTESLQALDQAYAGDERRKWGIEKRGLCLLLSWTAQLLLDPGIKWPK